MFMLSFDCRHIPTFCPFYFPDWTFVGHWVAIAAWVGKGTPNLQVDLCRFLSGGCRG